MKAKVIIGMSGGVDSSVAAWLLLQQGYAVEGLFMKNWEQDDTQNFCSAAADLADAKAVCQQLRIPLHQVNFSEEYWDRVFSLFLQEYAQGRTPNPDVLCNKEIKFKVFLEYALSLGADYIATGHYAKIQSKNNKLVLLKPKDKIKDQTYFLHAISPEVLSQTLFPIGDYLKSEVKIFAKEQGLITHDKKESTGICFIGERRFKTFLQEFFLAQPGDIISAQNDIIGRHDGLMFYTLGQRQGLGIGGRQSTTNAPWYVVDKLIPSNQLQVAQGQHHPLLYSQGLICGSIHWLTEPQDFPIACYAKTRYRQLEEACLVSPAQDGKHCVMFSNLQRAVTPGQYVVFYEKNCCLGGAVIEQIIR